MTDFFDRAPKPQTDFLDSHGRMLRHVPRRWSLGTLSAAFVRAEAAEHAAEIVAAHCANHYTCDARAREARRVTHVSKLPKPMLVNLAGWQNAGFETRRLKLGRDARAHTSRKACECLESVTVPLRAEERCIDQQPCSCGFPVVPTERSRVHLAYVPKTRGRIDKLAFVTTDCDRDYHIARVSYIVPKSGGRTKARAGSCLLPGRERRTIDSESCRSTADCPTLSPTRCSRLPIPRCT